MFYDFYMELRLLRFSARQTIRKWLNVLTNSYAYSKLTNLVSILNWALSPKVFRDRKKNYCAAST